MTTLYAFLVGIDVYRAEAVPRLYGCGNDVAAAEVYLRDRIPPGTSLEMRVVRDADATRAAVIDGFRSHLRRAGPSDVALFWFSGHGATARLPADMAHLEPEGAVQTLVCADSRAGANDLWDKEVALLLHEVAEGGGHVAAVVDSCHSESATRLPDADTPWAGRTRAVARAPETMPDALLPGVREAVADGLGTDPPYVTLSACRAVESAREGLVDGEYRGLFSWALLDSLDRLGEGASCRELLTAARCEVENRCPGQVPRLSPAGSSRADQPLFGGAAAAPRTFTMRYLRGDWEVSAGACHGMPNDRDDPLHVGVPGSDPPREARVSSVETTRSIVTPLGWEPDPQQQYPMVVTRVPMPPTLVALDGDGHDPGAVARLREHLRCTGPTGGPSPHVRLVEDAPVGEAPQLWLRCPDPTTVTVFDSAGQVVDESYNGPESAVARLEHIARWRRVHALANPASSLTGAVTLEVVPARPGERVVPRDRPALQPGADGAVHLSYRWDGRQWVAPRVFLRMRNRSGRRLYCALLDLTDRYRVHTGLFPGEFIAGGHCGAALNGGQVEFRLPPGRPAEPGSVGRDWLKLLVTEDEFDPSPFMLPLLGEQVVRGRTHRSPYGIGTVVMRLGTQAVHRDGGWPAEEAVSEWVTSTLPVVTSVPHGGDR